MFADAVSDVLDAGFEIALQLLAEQRCFAVPVLQTASSSTRGATAATSSSHVAALSEIPVLATAGTSGPSIEGLDCSRTQPALTGRAPLANIIPKVEHVFGLSFSNSEVTNIIIYIFLA